MDIKFDYLSIVRRYFLFLFLGKKISLIRVIANFFFVSLLPLFVYLGSFYDNTLMLKGNGKGLLQHYGVWSFFITTPFLILTVYYLIFRFISLLNKIKKYMKGNSLSKELRNKLQFHINSLSLKNGNTKYIFVLFVIIGILSTLLNIKQTIHPITTYGNDVFDSFDYTWGFIANKIYIGFLWSLVYPTCFFIVFHITISMISILKFLSVKKLLFIDFFSEDNCGGVSEFGFVNFLTMSLYFYIMNVVGFLHLTHSRNYLTIIIPTIMITVLFLLHSFYGIYYLYKFVREEKIHLLQIINIKLNANFNKLEKFPKELLYLRKHVMTVKTFPYSNSISLVIKIFPAFSFLFTIYKAIFL